MTTLPRRSAHTPLPFLAAPERGGAPGPRQLVRAEPVHPDPRRPAASLARRGRVWVAAAVAVGALTSCTFSTRETTEVSAAQGSGMQGSGTPQPQKDPGSSTGPRPDGAASSARPHVSPLCDALTDAYLSDLSSAQNPSSIVNKWAQLSASAPAALKPDLETVAAYLRSAARKDYATLKTSSDRVQSALDHIDGYVTRVCHA